MANTPPPRRTPSARKPSAANPLWGGGFSQAPASLLQQVNTSLDFDRTLWREDITASRAHVLMLVACDILSKRQGQALARGLDAVARELGDGTFPFRAELEDIHMNIEARLGEKIGADLAGRLHTARSRNDQAVTDLRLWLRAQIDALDTSLEALQAELIRRAEEEADTAMPGYTHLQRAQVISLGHWCLAWTEALGRDRERLRDARGRINRSPLGAGALGGTGFPIDPRHTAKTLGFDSVLTNSLDAVSTRDFALEFLAAGAVLGITLSRLGEDLVLWSSSEFGFIRFSDAWSTGSSMMPNKRNPDAAELLRGKSGRLVGSLMTLLTVTKGLPLGYAKDLQEDKEPLFDAVRTLALCIDVARALVEDFTPARETMRSATEGGALWATDFADRLVQTRGIPFREAHATAARLAARTYALGVSPAELPPAEFEALVPNSSAAERAAFARLAKPSTMLAARNSAGGTAPARVRAAARKAKVRFLQEPTRTKTSARAKAKAATKAKAKPKAKAKSKTTAKSQTARGGAGRG